MEWGFVVLTLLAAALAAGGVRVLGEHERGVVFRLGRLRGGVRGPGLTFLIPAVDRMFRVHVAPEELAIGEQNLPTRDGGLLCLSTGVRYRVADPIKSVSTVADARTSVRHASERGLRSLSARRNLEDFFERRDVLEGELQDMLSEALRPFGVAVMAATLHTVEIQKKPE
ncbi:hypothetical protein E0L93_10850 [Rubrobacter taiwanensis]|jgi:regulator of protease activity HflC (stomatin/prohibitin superfamily)|uniref:Band 7 domain-containing protein n=1 Tax=Rubrobacter taiwanensis TaxID=185139 RepID=A0A4R1BG98_9ACTN|nr:SPFH domain-containing protein [Rubrobacter taiwanensis]TCJ16164.1 hypothetical protein E0L93_10850 [Rubrobacter taiwanensis]